MLDGCIPWPADTVRHYQEAGAWSADTLATLIENSVREFPTNVALVHRDRTITYAALDEQVERLSSGFCDEGLVPGDRVLVQLPNVPEFVIVCLALFRIGVNPVLALPQYRSNEIRYICEHAGAVGYVVSGNAGFDYVGLGRELLASSPTLRRVYVADRDPGSDGSPSSDPNVVALAGVDAPPRSHADRDPADVAFFLLSGGTTAAPKLI